MGTVTLKPCRRVEDRGGGLFTRNPATTPRLALERQCYSQFTGSYVLQYCQ